MTERTCQQRASVLQHLNVLVSGMLCSSTVGKVRLHWLSVGRCAKLIHVTAVSFRTADLPSLTGLVQPHHPVCHKWHGEISGRTDGGSHIAGHAVRHGVSRSCLGVCSWGPLRCRFAQTADVGDLSQAAWSRAPGGLRRPAGPPVGLQHWYVLTWNTATCQPKCGTCSVLMMMFLVLL